MIGNSRITGGALDSALAGPRINRSRSFIQSKGVANKYDQAWQKPRLEPNELVTHPSARTPTPQIPRTPPHRPTTRNDTSPMGQTAPPGYGQGSPIHSAYDAPDQYYSPGTSGLLGQQSHAPEWRGYEPNQMLGQSRISDLKQQLAGADRFASRVRGLGLFDPLMESPSGGTARQDSGETGGAEHVSRAQPAQMSEPATYGSSASGLSADTSATAQTPAQESSSANNLQKDSSGSYLPNQGAPGDEYITDASGTLLRLKSSGGYEKIASDGRPLEELVYGNDRPVGDEWDGSPDDVYIRTHHPGGPDTYRKLGEDYAQKDRGQQPGLDASAELIGNDPAWKDYMDKSLAIQAPALDTNAIETQIAANNQRAAAIGAQNLRAALSAAARARMGGGFMAGLTGQTLQHHQTAQDQMGAKARADAQMANFQARLHFYDQQIEGLRMGATLAKSDADRQQAAALATRLAQMRASTEKEMLRLQHELNSQITGRDVLMGLSGFGGNVTGHLLGGLL